MPMLSGYKNITQHFWTTADKVIAMGHIIKRIRLISIILLASTLAACAGEDYMPVYFPPPDEATGEAPGANQTRAGKNCKLAFTSQLCVKIKKDLSDLDVGTKTDDALCAEVAPFPIHVEGNKLTIKGNEFPDVMAEGHGLPAPITINAKGNGDGVLNIGEGTIDAAGQMVIKNFSLFIVALGVEGEISGLTLTTGTTEELPELPAETGSPADAAGAMRLVLATVLGHTIDAADKYLMGASLSATFDGSISPTLSECGGNVERTLEIKKLIISKDGKQTEASIPNGNKLEISSGTYIPDGNLDIGSNFENTVKFKIKNIGTKPQSIQIPSRVGPFYFKSIEPLSKTVAPQQSLIVDITFKPSPSDNQGQIEQTLSIGFDQFVLVGHALTKSGNGTVSVVRDDGTVSAPNVADVNIGRAEVAANAERSFFHCKEIECNGSKLFTSCASCPDPSTTPCELLPISTEGKPIGEVDAKCKLIDPKASPLLTIDLNGSKNIEISGHKQVLAIRNKGVALMQITGIDILEQDKSKSTGQFSIPSNAMFIANSFTDVQKKTLNFPVSLPAYQPGYDETTLYIVVTYTPNDLMGFDGVGAGVGSFAKDKAIIRIKTDIGDLTTLLNGTTTIHETAPLELYFRTSSGAKHIEDGEAFSFRGVKPTTIDIAFPFFLRVADSSRSGLRVTSISIDGPDASNFRLLNTAEKIASVSPPSDKGMRCSIATVDQNGNMIGERFDLKPVSLEPPGFDISPGAYTQDTMPLFGCIDFHKDENGAPNKKIYEARLVISAQELDASGLPARNPDGSFRQTSLNAKLLSAINPRSGYLVLRVSQTMAAILNPKFPILSAVSSHADQKIEVAGGAKIQPSDQQVFIGSLILDPFDELTIKSTDGKEIMSEPNDGITGVFRIVDTHPVSENYNGENLFDYSNLIHDAARPEGNQGIYEDENYPNKPQDVKANGWRIFTGSLSYPGPLAPPDKKPEVPSECEIINPCSPEGMKKFTVEGAKGGKGACAFFYASGGRYDSPAFHQRSADFPDGSYDNLCNQIDKPQKLIDVNTGRYSVDGRISFEDIGFRFFGPTFFNNPYCKLWPTPKPPMDEVFRMSFTTGILKPQTGPSDPNVLPDEKIDIAKQEFKINLTDPKLPSPPICKGNTKNREVNGKKYSSWKFLENMLVKDEEGKIPAGCPEDGNNFTGGSAYLRGMDLKDDGTLTFVAGAKFGSSDDLTFAFKDVMIFVVINGWLCDPSGNEENFEGKRCYEPTFNDRDAVGQISLIK